MYRVLIVARTSTEQEMLRSAIASTDILVTGAVSSWASVGHQAFDVLVVMKDSLRDILAAGQRDETPPLVVCTDDARAPKQLAAARVPAWGLVPGRAAPPQLQAAVVAVAHGLCVMPPANARPAAGGLDDDEFDAPEGYEEGLTPREREVLEMASRGLSNRDIGVSLGISDHTVKFHLAAVYGKLGVSTRTAAVRRGLRRGVIAL